jgi:DNA invertase Pin-like site-specific DNA recombinase
MPRKRKTLNPQQCVGYLRVSTEDQNLGPDAQRAALERWASANGCELGAVFVDHGVSGAAALDKRPALMDAIDAMRDTGAGVLLVAKRDRLARDLVVAGMVERLVERAGGRIVSADGAGNGDGPEAALMRGIMDVFAQYERAVIRTRTRAALKVKRERGEKTGGRVPFGFSLDADGVHLVENEAEQGIIEIVVDLRRDGLSIRAIAERLNDDGVPARGTRWHRTTVDRLLKRAA